MTPKAPASLTKVSSIPTTLPFSISEIRPELTIAIFEGYLGETRPTTLAEQVVGDPGTRLIAEP